MKGFAVGLLGTAFLLLGCRKDIQNPEAVRQGIMEYLAKRSDLVSMDVSVGSVSFRQNEADALVYFRAKDGPANNGMEMKYILERKENRWVVKGRGGSGSASNPHQGVTPGMGQQEMPMDSVHGRAAPALPPGHPPIPPQQPALPPQ